MCSSSSFQYDMIGGRLLKDRADAARQLAADRLQHPLMLTVPRGALPRRRLLADTLGGAFDVVLVGKRHAPFNREFAVGASTGAATATVLVAATTRPESVRAVPENAVAEREEECFPAFSQSCQS